LAGHTLWVGILHGGAEAGTDNGAHVTLLRRTTRHDKCNWLAVAILDVVGGDTLSLVQISWSGNDQGGEK